MENKNTSKPPHTKWKNQRISRIYIAIKHRCYDSKRKDYRWYGAKGIKMCQQWLDNPSEFEKWALENGYADNLTIDRINADKDYTPDNCQWILLTENTRKAGKVNWITVDGITLTGKQWADRLHLGTNVINTSIREYGIDKTKELIAAMLKDSPVNKKRKPTQSWFSVYGISIDNKDITTIQN